MTSFSLKQFLNKIERKNKGRRVFSFFGSCDNRIFGEDWCIDLDDLEFLNKIERKKKEDFLSFFWLKIIFGTDEDVD